MRTLRDSGNCLAWRPLSLLLVAVGCWPGTEAGRDRPSDTPSLTPPAIRDSAGITIVENAVPQWTAGSEWRVDALLTSVGAAEGDPAHELYRVMDATRLSDGTVAVGNSSSGEIRFFRQDGTFVRSVGSKGGGPGEFRGANALRALRSVAGDTLITWDIYAQSVSVFAPDGEFVRSFLLDGPSRQHFFAGIFEDRALLMHVFEPTFSGSVENMPEGVIRASIILYHYGVDHSLIGHVEDIVDSDRFQARWGPWGMMLTDAPFGRTTSINVGGSRIYVATGDSDEITVYDQSGQVQMLIRRTLAPTAVTTAMIRRDKARRLEEEQQAHLEESRVAPRVRRMIAELPYPPVLPPYGSTVLDSELNLWVEEFRVAGDGPYDWSVFDSQGIWLGRVTLPEGLEVFEIGPDYILGKTVDDVGVERVEVYELVEK
ncbi:MAG: hypothetical protein JSW71_02705 [Gemmatimonadota bacterium]|nr:MAG: hypothetical protein JSW71_02705 [Gemmatimonadota bacterium]